MVCPVCRGGLDVYKRQALYLSKYDPATGSWGAGTMLAMSRMDVYEDSLNAGWSTEEAGEAYLGRLDGYDKGGICLLYTSRCV